MSEESEGLREKKSHLRSLLSGARINPGQIPEGGRIVFNYQAGALGESYVLTLCVDERGNPYFTGSGTDGIEGEGTGGSFERSSSPGVVLRYAARYFPSEVGEFKRCVG